MPCHWICKRDWFEIGECVRWGLFIFLALRPFVVKHVFTFSNHFNFFFFTLFLKYLEFLASFAFFFLVKGTLLTLIPTAMVRKGLIRRGVCLFFTIGHYRKLIYLFFSVKAHSSVCRMLKGTWHIILGEKVHAWSTQISLFSTSFIPYQAVSSVCMWLFKKTLFFGSLLLLWRAFLWDYCQTPIRFLCEWHPEKKYHKWHKAAVVQRNKENLCWLFFSSRSGQEMVATEQPEPMWV